MPTNNPAVFMFSGQGSAYFQMGRSLYDTNSAFSGWLRRMDEFVGDITGQPVLPTLYGAQSKAVPLIDISITHPAIFMVEYALAQTLIGSGVKPDYTLGASLGSYAAAAISGCISMEDALSLVLKQASTLQATCEPGAMIAILANPVIRDQASWKNQSEIAAVNFDNHFVISTAARYVREIEQSLRDQAAVYQTLPVTFAFHSAWIDPARDNFQRAVSAIPLATAHLPVICCAQAEIFTDLPNEFFWNAARLPIQFAQAVNKLEAIGSFNYLDLGPSGTLATFLKYILPAPSTSLTKAVITPYGREAEALIKIVNARQALQK